jgi:predicted choloylglycine hydrolase
MNIFILDKDLKKNAEYHADKHVVKMILESAQILSTVVRKSGIDAGYKETHKNHPCVLWAEESLDNWLYLKDLVQNLHDEWKYRYKHPESKTHKSYDIVQNLPLPNIESKGLTPFAQAMPDKYKNDDAVIAYRNYYNGEKSHLFSWKNRDKPEWINEI